MSRYDELDAVYRTHPELREFLRAAADVIRAYDRPRGMHGNHLGPYLDVAIKRMRKLGPEVDNRDWLK